MSAVFSNNVYEVFMRKFTILLAGKKIEIQSVNDYIYDYCKKYICGDDEEKPDIKIEIFDKDIEFERKKSEQEDICEGRNIRNFSDSYLETLAAYRKIAEKLIEEEIILFHSSVVALEGKGYLFAAKSGTGKSTHTRLWCEYFGKSAVMVNDDKPLLKLEKNQVYVYGTPWDGKHRISNNVCVPVAGVCFLERGENNEIGIMERKQGFNRLLEYTYKSNEPEKMIKTIDILKKMEERVPLYKLICNMDISAVKIAYEGMKK